ncbi:hypothetical protein ACQP2K_21970 [Microbispora siamensis]
MRNFHARGNASGPLHKTFIALGALVLSAAALTVPGKPCPST